MANEGDGKTREGLAEEGVVSVAEACQFLRLSESELYAIMGRGDLPFCKFGRRRTIPKNALIAHVAKHMTATQV